MQIRDWLKIAPPPVRVVAQYGNGDERTVKIGSARSRWRDAESALDGAVRCEAIDRDDQVLRVWQAEPAARVEPTVHASAGNPMAMIAEIARLLVDAADRSAERHAEAYRLAYEQQGQVVSLVLSRLQSLETAWHEVVLSQRDDGADEPIGSTSDELVRTVLSMAPTVVGGMFGAGSSSSSSAPPNHAPEAPKA